MIPQTLIEFTNAARDTRVKGSRRLLVITHGLDVTRLEIKGDAIDGDGLFTISDVTVPTATYEQSRDVILNIAKASAPSAPEPVKDALVPPAKLSKRDAFLATNPAIVDALVAITEPVHANNAFVKDVLSKLNRYDSLSDAQVNAVVTSLRRDIEYAARKAVEATEVKGDAPTGRVEVTGTVLSVKVKENDYGFVRKALIKLENNAKVWVTAPDGVERDLTVTIKATWTPSQDDRHFAFGKRPILVSAGGSHD